jgi:hypothetical protein
MFDDELPGPGTPRSARTIPIRGVRSSGLRCGRERSLYTVELGVRETATVGLVECDPPGERAPRATPDPGPRAPHP